MRPKETVVATLKRRRTQRGHQAIEFGLALIPLMTVLALILDVSWTIFAKSTLQNAVRNGCRLGVTNLLTEGENYMVPAIKHRVQYMAMGLLGADDSDPRAALINVEYKESPDPACTTDCQLRPAAGVINQGGNFIMVSVENYQVAALLPIFFYNNPNAMRSPLTVNAYSIDRIEPVRSPPRALPE